jgi:hypothetical protein
MSRKAGAYVLAGVLATTVYYGALVAVSPTFIDLGVADGVPGAVDAPPAHGERKVPATGQHSEGLSRQSRDRNTAYASVGGERPAAPPNPAVYVAAPRPVVANTARDESSTIALPVEERIGPDGGTYLLRNLSAAETEANERAWSAARDATLHEARRDPAAFAARHGLEPEDLQSMLAGGRPFPDYLVAGAK